jgi:hypothetical protein
MKGTIAKCLAEMVTERFGKDRWENILQTSGLSPGFRFMATQDVDDDVVYKVVDSVCSILNLSLPQVADAFGDYWGTVYAPKIYGAFYETAKSAREFLLKMDDVHVTMTRMIPDARPPRFEYEWQDDKTLIMKYKSLRGLIDLVAGLAKGVGKYYKEDLRVTRLGSDRVKIVFP